MAYNVQSGQVSTGIILTNNSMYISQGGIAKDTVINAAGELHILSGGSASNTVVNSNGYLFIESGGTATNIVWTPCVGSVSAAIGAEVTYASQYSGVYLSSSGQVVHAQTMTDKVVALEMYVMSDGQAINTTVSNGGTMNVSSGGIAENTLVQSGADCLVSDKGIANNTTVTDGEFIVFSNGIASGTELNKGTFAVYMGYAENAIINQGEMQVALLGSAKNVTINTATMLVFNNAVAENITVNSGGLLGVYGNALVNNVTVSGGEFSVTTGGVANNTTVEANGTMTVTELANNTTVKSGGSLTVMYGWHTGTLTIENGASVMALGNIEFTVSGRTTGDDYLINNISLISGLPSFSILVSDDQAYGTYKLAQGAGNFSASVTINNGSVNFGAATVNGRDCTYQGKIYSVDQIGGNLTLTISPPDIDLVPYQPSGWSDKLVISTDASSTIDAAQITVEDNVFISFSLLNDGSVNAGKFDVALYLDGNLVETWNANSLQSNYYTYVTGFDLGKLSAGVHTLKLVTDNSGLIAETNEDNNTFTKTITVKRTTAYDVKRNDVNGDGIADIVMINSRNMAGAWLMGADGSSKWLELSGLPGTWDLFYVGNLNDDKYADVLLYDDTNKDIGAWYVDEKGIPHWASLGRIAADTTLIAANDFNGDELIDMAFRKNDGTITVQINDGANWSMALPKEWNVVATGDINGDGTADFIFRNGNAVGGWTVTAAGPSWVNLASVGAESEIIAAGDFNGDGTDDILINTNGSLGAWIMKDGKVSSWKALGNYSETVKFESIGDYNGDGIDDIRVRDGNDLAAIYSYEDSYGWKKFGSVPSDWRTQIPAAEETGALRNDINGDGVADIAMIQAGTDAGAWLMGADGNSKWLGLSGLPGTWTLFDVQNVDGNKYADIILYDDTNKDVGLWLMDAKGVPTWKSGGKIAADAKLIAAGDWNGDGLADVVYRKANGTVGFKYFNGAANKEVGLPTDWEIAGVGDINGDGCDDLVLRNGNAMGAWLMGAAGPSWQNLSSVSADNQVIGLGDFNGDGTDDVLFNTNGALGAWLMKDGQVIGWRAFATFPASVTVESISDYNGDGTDDLRVRNGNDLAAVYSYTDGSIQWKHFGSVPGNWTTALAGKA